MTQKAKPVLTQHRGWKDFWAKLFLCVGTLGFGAIYLAARKSHEAPGDPSPYSRNRFFQPLTKTSGAKKLEKLDEAAKDDTNYNKKR